MFRERSRFMAVTILGISAYHHDSAACLLRDGNIVDNQEERFSRKKHDARFPRNAIQFCLKQGEIEGRGPQVCRVYDKPMLKFNRLIETYIAFSLKAFARPAPEISEESLMRR
jgi:carbamoyltransferase